MIRYARWLFGISAAMNVSIAVLMLAAQGWVARQLALTPVTGSNVTLYTFAALLIGLFGYAYFRVARDPVAYRPVIHITAIGKLMAFASAALPWAAGIISARLPMVMAADVVLAVVFLDYLRRTRT